MFVQVIEVDRAVSKIVRRSWRLAYGCLATPFDAKPLLPPQPRFEGNDPSGKRRLWSGGERRGFGGGDGTEGLSTRRPSATSGHFPWVLASAT